MEITKNKNATIKNSHQSAAFQCLPYHFLLPLFLHSYKQAGTYIQGLLVPALFLAEFLILVPLYFIFFRKREGLGRGSFDWMFFYSFL